jgi:sialidase-1
MRKLFIIIFLLPLLASAQDGLKNKTMLFLSNQTDSIPYRIPAVAELKDGSLYALTDYRHCKADIGFGRVDIHGKRLKGRKWGKEFVLIVGTGVEGAVNCGYGDPSIVADRESKEILVVLVCGNTVYFHPTTTRQNPNRITAMRSLDGGKTWDREEITEQIYSLFDDAPDGCVQSCFVASGQMFQSRLIKIGSHYRIYAALTARPNGNRVIYSDDLGRTWNVLGTLDQLPVPHGDEAKCEELPDGSVVISSRAYGGRYFNIYRYSDIASGAGAWAEAAPSGRRVKGCASIENACNGGLLIIPAVRNADGQKVMLALQSVPFGPKRANVGIYAKELPQDLSSITPEQFAKDWDMKYQVSYTWSAYSTMLHRRNGDIAFYYEESHKGSDNVYDMHYCEIPVELITSGRYRAVK